MPVDQWALLKWMANREENEPGEPTQFGTTFLQQAAGLAGDDGLPWDAVTRSAVHLKRLGHIDWRYVPYPNVDPPEPPLEHISSSFLQRVNEVHVTGKGHAALASRKQSESGTQINIIHSTVGNLALGDMTNVNLLMILEAAERSLDDVAGPPDAKDEARGILEKVRKMAGETSSAAVTSVLSAAVRHALGLP